MTDKVWLRWEVCGGFIRIQWAPHWYSPDLPWWSSSVLLVLSLGEATPYWRWLLRWLTPPNNTQHHSDHHKPQSAPPQPSYPVRTAEKVRGRREELERYELWERGRQVEWCWHNCCRFSVTLSVLAAAWSRRGQPAWEFIPTNLICIHLLHKDLLSVLQE